MEGYNVIKILGGGESGVGDSIKPKVEMIFEQSILKNVVELGLPLF